MKKLKLFLVSFAFITAAKAQTPYELIEDPNRNYHEVVKQLNEYFKSHSKEKGNGYKMFKRWEAEMKYWIDEQGNRINPADMAAEYNKFNATYGNHSQKKGMSTTWEELDTAETSNSEVLGSGKPANATKVTPAQSGNYALKLETNITSTDTNFAYVLFGMFGDNGPEGGFPYSQKPTTSNGY